MYQILEGDVIDQLKTLADASVDAIVTDPPYGLEFMGKDWDAPWKTDRRQGFKEEIEMPDNPYGRSKVRNGNGASYGAGQRTMQALQAWHFAWAAEALRVLKPGGHLLAFGGSRTYHRLACAVEDAGFEIRDQIMWIYGSGFPKSLDVSKQLDKIAGVERMVVGVSERGSGAHQIKLDNHESGDTGIGYMDGSGKVFELTEPTTDAAKQWQGWGTALKPAHEPIVVARKPLEGTVAANVLQWGTGAIHIDACRVGNFQNTTPPGTDRYNAANFEQGYRPSAYGRRGEASAERRYATSGSTNFSLIPGPRGGAPEGRWPANVIHDGSEEVVSLFPQSQSGENCVKRATGVENGGQTGAMFGAESRKAGSEMIAYGDSGSASRFFYCAKADRAERNAGLEGLEKRRTLIGAEGHKIDPLTGREVVDLPRANTHPTVKPVDLMAYLCRLVTPAGGTVLDLFLGSGTTGIAALREGFDFIGIEVNPEYVKIARTRIEADAPLFNRGDMLNKEQKPGARP